MSTTRLALLAGLALSSVAVAQQPGTTPPSPIPSKPAASAPAPSATLTPPAAPMVVSPRNTVMRLAKPLTADLNDQRLEDVITFIGEFTGAVIEPHWRTATEDGLDKEFRVNLKFRNTPALTAIEKILVKAKGDGISENGWQMTSDGALEIGPKERLNLSKRLVIYPIADLLTDLPRYTDAPQLDLQGVLQQGGQGGGGGGGQSPFRDEQTQRVIDPAEQQRRIDRIIELITTLVEPDQWVSRGGTGATIEYFQGAILVNGPDYVHRQLNGYAWWPNTTSTTSGGRRYVSLNLDTGLSTVDGFAKQPVTGIVGGGGGGAGGGGGGGRR